MTPTAVAELVARELEHPVAVAVDLAVGDGALLAAVHRRWPVAQLFGVDCDSRRTKQARTALPGAVLRTADGLVAQPPASMLDRCRGRVVVVGNPPYLPVAPGPSAQRLQERAFPGVTSRHGWRRAEVSFLARALLLARACGGKVAMLLPSAFASGLQYLPYRTSLMSHYRVEKAIQIDGAGFRDTEAHTVLLIIDAASSAPAPIEVARFSASSGVKTIVHQQVLPAGSRVDARYWAAAALRVRGQPTLADVGVDIQRGRHTYADARRSQRTVVHTTHLSRLRSAQLRIRTTATSVRADDVLAQPGDVLICRTGTRVRWSPVSVVAGVAPITDHVLRIRPPKALRAAVHASFHHPLFASWLDSVAKGVCATVLTKQELMQMPLFAADVAPD
jgi:hypothetical protein